MSNDTQVDHSTCSANGCPMLATHSRTTTGDNWLCFIHHAAQPDLWHLYTLELQRLQWLVTIVRNLRAARYLGKEQGQQIIDAARKQVTLSQRGDLQMKDSEGGPDWMIRLEGVLLQSCKNSLVQP